MPFATFWHTAEHLRNHQLRAHRFSGAGRQGGRARHQSRTGEGHGRGRRFSMGAHLHDPKRPHRRLRGACRRQRPRRRVPESATSSSRWLRIEVKAQGRSPTAATSRSTVTHLRIRRRHRLSRNERRFHVAGVAALAPVLEPRAAARHVRVDGHDLVVESLV